MASPMLLRSVISNSWDIYQEQFVLGLQKPRERRAQLAFVPGDSYTHVADLSSP